MFRFLDQRFKETGKSSKGLGDEIERLGKRSVISTKQLKEHNTLFGKLANTLDQSTAIVKKYGLEHYDLSKQVIRGTALIGKSGKEYQRNAELIAKQAFELSKATGKSYEESRAFMAKMGHAYKVATGKQLEYTATTNKAAEAIALVRKQFNDMQKGVGLLPDGIKETFTKAGGHLKDLYEKIPENIRDTVEQYTKMGKEWAEKGYKMAIQALEAEQMRQFHAQTAEDRMVETASHVGRLMGMSDDSVAGMMRNMKDLRMDSDSVSQVFADAWGLAEFGLSGETSAAVISENMMHIFGIEEQGRQAYIKNLMKSATLFEGAGKHFEKFTKALNPDEGEQAIQSAARMAAFSDRSISEILDDQAMANQGDADAKVRMQGVHRAIAQTMDKMSGGGFLKKMTAASTGDREGAKGLGMQQAIMGVFRGLGFGGGISSSQDVAALLRQTPGEAMGKGREGFLDALNSNPGSTPADVMKAGAGATDTDEKTQQYKAIIDGAMFNLVNAATNLETVSEGLAAFRGASHLGEVFKSILEPAIKLASIFGTVLIVVELFESAMEKLPSTIETISGILEKTQEKMQAGFEWFERLEAHVKTEIKDTKETVKKTSKAVVGGITSTNPVLGGVLSGARKIMEHASGGPKIEGRASGGPISAGRPVVVGEEGPELVVPNTGGTVIPNQYMGYFTNPNTGEREWGLQGGGNLASGNHGGYMGFNSTTGKMEWVKPGGKSRNTAHMDKDGGGLNFMSGRYNPILGNNTLSVEKAKLNSIQEPQSSPAPKPTQNATAEAAKATAERIRHASKSKEADLLEAILEELSSWGAKAAYGGI